MKRNNYFRFALFTIILIIIGLCLYSFFFIEDKFVGQIDDLSRYSEVRGEYQEITGHFPEVIPLDARDVRFHFHPRYMQGGMDIQLRLQLSSHQIYELEDNYSHFTKYLFTDGKIDNGEMNGSGIPQLQIFVQEEDEDLLLESSIYYLHTEPLGENDFLWNHGIAYGVIIHREKCLVIYWTRNW